MSPLKAPDLSALPPAYVLVAGCDPLRDEGLAYADRLRSAGVETRVEIAEETIHGFLSFGVLDLARTGRRTLAADVRSRLGPPSG